MLRKNHKADIQWSPAITDPRVEAKLSISHFALVHQIRTVIYSCSSIFEGSRLAHTFSPPRDCRCHVLTLIISPDDKEAREDWGNTQNSQSLTFWYLRGSGWKSWQISSSLANVSLKLHNYTQFSVYIHETHFALELDNFILTRANIWHECRVNWLKIMLERQDFYLSFNIAIERWAKQNAATLWLWVSKTEMR